MVKWLEISADYACNQRCLGCFSVDGAGPSMDASEVAETLRYGREQSATGLWLGGGDPTLRRDLAPMIATARKLGYQRVKLQTNGMLLAYPQLTRRWIEAGATELNLSIKGACAATHDRLTRTPGGFGLMEKGLAQWRRHGLPVEGDVLLYRSNVEELPEIVGHFFPLGIGQFHVWMLSGAVEAGEDVAAELPRMSEVVAALEKTLALGLSDRPDFLESLHTPACVLRGQTKRCLFHAAALEMIVANPGRHRFRLEESPIEGGHYTPRCGSCAARASCGGIRADYLARFGDAEFQPLTAAAR